MCSTSVFTSVMETTPNIDMAPNMQSPPQYTSCLFSVSSNVHIVEIEYLHRISSPILVEAKQKNILVSGNAGDEFFK